MGIESLAGSGRRKGSREHGFALVAVLIALALLTTIGLALTSMGTVEYQTALNHRSATRALLLADAGATHALALMRGSLSDYEYSEILKGTDGVWDTPDDGGLYGHSLAESDALPDTGFLMNDGRYFVTIVNDDGDPSGDPATDDNHRVIAVCRGETHDGGVAEIRAMLAALSFPAIVTNGDLTMPGTPDVLGPCAGVHTNGTLHVTGNPTVDGEVTASDTVILSGTITDAAGYVVQPRSDQPPVDIPDYDPLDYCAAADYVLKDGWVVTVGPPRDSSFAGSGEVLGWSWDAVTNEYSLKGNNAVDGVVCAYGNIKITGNAGSNGDPLEITLLATGSVNVGGTPKLAAAHPDGILIVTAGDLDISGNSSGTTPAYSGMLYAGSQCRVNGTPDLGGYLLCYDGEDPAGAIDLIAENKINGNPSITYDCSGERRKMAITAWWEARAQ